MNISSSLCNHFVPGSLLHLELKYKNLVSIALNNGSKRLMDQVKIAIMDIEYVDIARVSKLIKCFSQLDSITIPHPIMTLA